MPTGLADSLTAPLRELQSLVGPGSGAELAAALHEVRTALDDVAAATGQSWRRAAPHWSGPGAEAAANAVMSTAAQAEELAERIGHLGKSADAAGAAVARARQRLDDIVAAFEARAAALQPHLDSPGVTEELVAEARRALEDAVAVVEQLRDELDGQAAALPAATTAPAATAPASFSAPAMPSSGGFGSSGASTLPAAGSGLGTSAGGGLGALVRDVAEFSRPDASTPEAAAFGDGVAVRLPDGSTATAPNAVAASAVRYALTQLGVPYDWGGTTPGVGLDCSGLTQWAYSEAGLTLPRLAQEQDIGAPVSGGDLRPGDLAVWDGHVAMIVGNGQMIEAGDPVQLSAVRTTNAGQGFQGFWRPTS
ncbi:C40 family peptidase [Mycobacterium sp. E740]|uniref:C40 family peptidase n=1 Tax=Mycobacterium sp. E740 TaxID=1834149 RepID=UPI0008000214|nr:C40 family peptidase [Mycobacterium sp. E740]OBI83031.1 glycoside hydrolase [Mycobacterium sp. E740]